MLPILINYKVIHHTLTYWEIILSMIIPKHMTYSPTCLTVETDDKHRYWQWQTEYCWGGRYSAHQAESKFAEHHIDMVSWVSRKCQTRAGVSGDGYKTLECVTKTDSKFSNRVTYEWRQRAHPSNGVTIWLEQLDFCLNRCKRELHDQRIPNSIFPHELFFNILIISTVCIRSWHTLGNETPGQSKVPHFRAWLLLITDPVIALVGPAYILFSLCCIQCHEVQHMRDIPPTVSEEQFRGWK